MEYLVSSLKKPPTLSLITGPVNSGKSWVMDQVLQKVYDERVAPYVLSFNMRQLPFLDTQSFVDVFIKKLFKWYEKFSINLKASGLEIELNVEWNHYPPKLTDLLNTISNSLPSWSLLRGTNIPLPILYIDEANLLRELVIKDVNGQKILKALLNWFVSMIKEYRKFQVVLCSSNSFIHSWVSNFVGNDRFNAIVIGHLSKEDAGTELLAKIIVAERHYLLMRYMMYAVVVCFYCTKCT